MQLLKNFSTPHAPVRPENRWIQSLHIAGSMASITGFLLLALNKAVGAIAMGEILGWLVSASLLLGVLTLIIIAVHGGASRLRQRIGTRFVAVAYLIVIPLAAVLMLLMFQTTREIVVPFIILIVHGQYPLP